MLYFSQTSSAYYSIYLKCLSHISCENIFFLFLISLKSYLNACHQNVRHARGTLIISNVLHIQNAFISLRINNTHNPHRKFWLCENLFFPSTSLYSVHPFILFSSSSSLLYSKLSTRWRGNQEILCAIKSNFQSINGKAVRILLIYISHLQCVSSLTKEIFNYNRHFPTLKKKFQNKQSTLRMGGERAFCLSRFFHRTL